jgi:hypothetical protein
VIAISIAALLLSAGALALCWGAVVCAVTRGHVYRTRKGVAS